MEKPSARTPGPRLRTLLYHGFVTRVDQESSLQVSAAAFDRQLRSLLMLKWRAMSLDEYVHVLDDPGAAGRRFLVTIDDGYVSVLNVAAPILLARRVPAVVFVPPACLGSEPPWGATPRERLVSRAEVRELKNMGLQFGVHGMDHSSLAGLSDSELRTQTSESRDMLAEVLGERPCAFAYPGGRYDARVRSAVRNAGYDVAFAVSRGTHDRFAVERTAVIGGNPTWLLHLQMTRYYRSLADMLVSYPRLRAIGKLVAGSRGRSGSGTTGRD